MKKNFTTIIIVNIFEFIVFVNLSYASITDTIKSASSLAIKVIVLAFAFSALVLYVTAKSCSIKNANYFKCLVTTFFSIIIGFILNVLFSVVPIIGNIIATCISFLCSSVITMVVFSTTFGRAFAAELMRWVLMTVLGVCLFIASCAGIISNFKDFLSTKNDIVAEKTIRNKAEDKRQIPLDNNKIAEEKRKEEELSQANVLKELEDKKKNCQNNVVDKYNKYGTYIKNSIVGDGYETITISTNTGDTYTAYYSPDDPGTFYKKIKGKQLQLKIERTRYWDEDSKQCRIDDICQDIIILNDTKLTNNVEENVKKFLLAKQFSFANESVDSYINFYADEVLFYNQKSSKDKLKKNFEAYTSKWVERNEKLERIDSIKKLESGNLEVVYTMDFSHHLANDEKCFSGTATTKACFATVNGSYVITEENKVSTIKDTPPKCW